VTVSLLLVVEREAEALTAERTRLRARGLIVDGICADNVCRRCSHCFREVVGLDIVGAVSWAEGGCWVMRKAKIAEELELLRRFGQNRGGRNWRARFSWRPPSIWSTVHHSFPG
jgi:hypothetical protein